MKDKKYPIFQWLLRSLLVIFFIFLLNRLIIFTGKVTYIQDFTGDKENISRIFPSSNSTALLKDLDNKTTFQTLNNITGYFDVKIPRGAEKLDLEISIKQPVDKITLSVPKSDYEIEQKQVYNQMLNNLSSDDWKKIIDEEKGLSLWQKKDTYISIDDFLANPPQQNALYSVSDYNLIKINDYTANNNQQEINLPLRGPHKIYTYLGPGEKLDWDFFYSELGTNAEIDPFALKLYHNNILLADEKISEHAGADRYHLEKTDLQEGVYLIELPESFDILFSRIQTRQHFFALADRADLYNADIASNLYLLGNNVKYKTIHNTGYQDIIINGQTININEAGKYYSNVLDKNIISKMEIPKSDLTIETDGLIFIDDSQLSFIQQLLKMKEMSSVNVADLEQIKYILTDYNEPKISDGNIILKTSFDIANVKLNGNDNLPVNINLSDVPSGGLRFYNIKATVHRPFIKYLKNLF